jgi:hypothetical protein
MVLTHTVAPTSILYNCLHVALQMASPYPMDGRFTILTRKTTEPGSMLTCTPSPFLAAALHDEDVHVQTTTKHEYDMGPLRFLSLFESFFEGQIRAYQLQTPHWA